MSPRILLVTAVLIAGAGTAHASLFTELHTFNVGAPSGSIPDDLTPVTFSQTITGSPIFSLTEVRVGLKLVGDPVGQGWAGDLFGSLNLDFGGQTSVLLNRPGVTAGDLLGHSFDGWDIAFRDDAANGDVHLGQPAAPALVLTGAWQPDGRLDPLDPARPALLSVFNAAPGNGLWNLTVADLSGGGAMRLQSWSLTLIGEAAVVPEPEAWAAIVGSGLAGYGLVRRLRRRFPADG